MRLIIYLILLTLLCGCLKGDSDIPVHAEKKEKKQLSSLKSVLNKDASSEPSYTKNNDKESTNVHGEDVKKKIPKTEYLKQFLLEPINLVAFKKQFGTSNSGVYNSTIDKHFLFKPSQKGFYFQYFRFNGLYGMKYPDGKEMSEGALFRNFTVEVYHYGENASFDFYDKNEELVGLVCAGSHSALGKADIVGKEFNSIVQLFGNEYASVNDVVVYNEDNRFLFIKLNEKKVIWYKYFRFAPEIDINDIPKDAFTFNIY